MSTQCQFYLTKKGCRNGSSCRFSHNNPATTTTNPTSSKSIATESSSPSGLPPSTTTSNSLSARNRNTPATRQPVKKPVPASLRNLDKNTAAVSLRNFEIGQVSSRFSASFIAKTPTGINDADAFELKIVPSDPDFPYEISALHVLLSVPKSYPAQSCTITVLNHDIPKGFAANLERGFNQTAQQQKSLLAHLNWLDVNMEQLLQKPPAPTIRFIAHANAPQKSSSSSTTNGPAPIIPPPLPPLPVTTQSSPSPSSSVRTLSSSQSHSESYPQSRSQLLSPPPFTPKTFTPADREQAKVQRQKQMNQIQARFRSSFESISPISVKISLDSTEKDKMPVKWEGSLKIVLLVPMLYPLEPCDIRLREDGNNPEIEIWRARNVEQGFRKITATMPQLSLFQLLNQLNRDLKELMSLPPPTTQTASPLPHPLSSSPQTILSSLPQPTSSATPTQLSSSPSTKDTHLRSFNVVENDHKGKVVYINALQEPPRSNFDIIRNHDTITSDDTGDDSNADTGEDEPSRNDTLDHTGSDHYTDTTESDTEHHSDEEDEEDEDSTKAGPIIDASAKRGIEVRMPDIKIDHISLMYCRSLSLLVRCARCKALVDIPDLVPDSSTSPSSIKISSNSSSSGTAAKHKWKTCENCQSLMGAHFRTEYIHMQSRTIGYLDLAGCTPYDILPSFFVPTCSECDHVHGSEDQQQQQQAGVDYHDLPDTQGSHDSTTSISTTSSTLRSAPAGFRQKVGRGMSATANCRKCHVRLTFIMDGEIKFVKLSPGDLMKATSADLELLPLRKRRTNKNSKSGLDFELKVGEPLPRKGACDHYKKSRRWFRFPCCSKVYPCDICHDEKESDHESVFAKRMVCGYCSREQTISEKPCACGRNLVRTSGGSGAFWEGGEGMRDRTRMSTKDPRKHKGLHKTVAKKQVGAENVRKRAAKS
ncbi:hypothetical protein FBU30_008645 [Linnemannia zychae]|nr:hypothetical protein FBU30_008645 [Linnemannia zychae]